jgi:sugar phosphate isomerase/epimerase
MLLYKEHGIELIGFWGVNDKALDLMKRHGIKTQFWVMMPDRGKEQKEKVENAARAVEGMAKKAKEIGCSVCLYNHGGWAGEPENQLEVMELLQSRGITNVGICYNLHHAHHRMKDLSALLEKMKPYLWCLNLNGMKEGTKILPFGKGTDDAQILRTIQKSGYRGPIGILGHRADVDAELALRQNLDGLKAMLEAIGDAAALKTY